MLQLCWVSVSVVYCNAKAVYCKILRIVLCISVGVACGTVSIEYSDLVCIGVRSSRGDLEYSSVDFAYGSVCEVVIMMVCYMIAFVWGIVMLVW